MTIDQRLTMEPHDDYFHTPSADLLWNESAWFSFSVPERELNGFVYINHRPNMATSMTGVALYDPSGEDVYDCLYYDWGEFHPLVRGETEMFDFTTANGLSVRCLEPLNRYAITYDRNGCELDLQFAGLAAVVPAPFEPGSDGWGPDHYEQPGVMTGSLRLGGQDYRVSCASNRDHSWGVRDYQRRSWQDFPRHDYPWFNDGAGYAMNMYTVPTNPPVEDPVIGVTDRLLSGWLLEGGEVGRLVNGSRRALERRPDGVPTRVAIDGEDDLGRGFTAEGRMVSVLKWSGLASLTVFWALYEWTLSTGQVCWGETGEVFPAEFGRRFLRSII